MKLPPYRVFPHLKTPELELREIRNSDLPELLEISVYDGKPAGSLEEAIEIEDRIRADYQEGNSLHWGIYDPQKQVMVGTCGFYRGFEGSVGELGCVLRSEFRGQGYMSAALKLAVDFGCQHMKLAGIQAITSSQNEAAIRLLQRLHFSQNDTVSEDQALIFLYQPFVSGM